MSLSEAPICRSASYYIDKVDPPGSNTHAVVVSTTVRATNAPPARPMVSEDMHFQRDDIVWKPAVATGLFTTVRGGRVALRSIEMASGGALALQLRRYAPAVSPLPILEGAEALNIESRGVIGRRKSNHAGPSRPGRSTDLAGTRMTFSRLNDTPRGFAGPVVS